MKRQVWWIRRCYWDGIVDGLPLLAWEQETFAYADSEALSPSVATGCDHIAPAQRLEGLPVCKIYRCAKRAGGLSCDSLI
jgi:hypothetical protein